MNDNYLGAFTSNKSTEKEENNFDIKELIHNFSLYDFIDAAKERPDEDFGGFLVCTPKQYLFGYNSGFGPGPHAASFARTMLDIKGGGIISNQMELIKI